MVYAPTNWQDGVTPVNAANLNKLEQGLAAAVGIPADVVVTPGAAHLIRSRLTAGDANPTFRLQADGRIEWGPGGATAPDTSLYRVGPNNLYTGGDFNVAGTLSLGGLVWMDSDSYFAHFLAAAGFGVMAFRANGDTAHRFILGNNGHMYWGAGAAATDTDLYRSAPGELTTGGGFVSKGGGPGVGLFYQPATAAGYPIASRVGAEPSSRWHVNVNGDMTWGPGASAGDVTLYRIGASYLGTNGAFLASGGLNTPATLNLQGNASYIYSGSSSLGYAVIISRAAGDADNRFTLSNNGHMYFADGTNPPDVQFRRYTAGYMGIEGGLRLTNNLVFDAQALGGFSIASLVPGDISYRFLLDNGGTLQWGPGNAVADTKLYRSSAGNLKTDGAFLAGGSVAVDHSGVGAALYFGTAMDVLLSRAGAGQLALQGGLLWVANRPNATDIAFQTGPPTGLGFYFDASGRMAWAAPGSGADTALFRAAAGVLKTDTHLHVGADLNAHVGASSQISLGDSVGRPIIYFSNLADTYLYRSAAAELKTDGKFVAGGDVISRQGQSSQITLGEASAGKAGVWIGDSCFYNPSAGTLKTDAGLQVSGLASYIGYDATTGWIISTIGKKVTLGTGVPIRFGDGTEQLTAASAGGISAILASHVLGSTAGTMSVDWSAYASLYAAIEIYFYMYQAGSQDNRTPTSFRFLPSQTSKTVTYSMVGHGGNSSPGPGAYNDSGGRVQMANLYTHSVNNAQPVGFGRIRIDSPGEARRHFFTFDYWMKTEVSGDPGADFGMMSGRGILYAENEAQAAVTGLSVYATSGPGFGPSSKLWCRGIGAHTSGF